MIIYNKYYNKDFLNILCLKRYKKYSNYCIINRLLDFVYDQKEKKLNKIKFEQLINIKTDYDIVSKFYSLHFELNNNKNEKNKINKAFQICKSICIKFERDRIIKNVNQFQNIGKKVTQIVV